MIHELKGSPDTTQTDFSVSVSGESLVLSMTKYKNGVHDIVRAGEVTIPFTADVDKNVYIYLVQDGTFVVDEVLQGGVPSEVEGLVDLLVWFSLPANGTLENINYKKVVEINVQEDSNQTQA